ncbi:MAG: MAPEG family protein [Rhodospirillales bacterium]
MKTSIAMSLDMHLLVYSTVICILMWVPYILAAIRTYGLVHMVSYPRPDNASIPQWAQRLNRAHHNLVENLTPFAILVIVAQMTGTANEMTALGARMFFYSRLGQIAFHTAGIPWGRTLFFAVGLSGMIIILLQVIGY